MSQSHTDPTVEHTEGQQDTGNHKVPSPPDVGGVEGTGGTRTGAGNVEGGKDKDLSEVVRSGESLDDSTVTGTGD